MEKRLILAIFLSFVVLFLYQLLFVKKPEVLPEDKAVTQTTVTSPEKPPLARSTSPPTTPSPENKTPEIVPTEIKPIAAVEETEVVVETPLYRAVWSNQGGVLKSWQLKKYKDDEGEVLELVSPRAQEVGLYPFRLETGDKQFDQTIHQVLFQPSVTSLNIQPGEAAELSFTYATEDGTLVTKTFAFSGDSYVISINITVIKNNTPLTPSVLWGPSITHTSPLQQKQRFGSGRGISILSGPKVYHQKEEKLKGNQVAFNFVTWAAYEDNYFAVIFLGQPEKTSALFRKETQEEGAPLYFLSVTNVTRAYLGPKDFELLSQLGFQTKKIIRFGFFGWIAEILLKAIKSIHSAFPNWGVAIIILTFIIKILFFPLTYSSTKSMAKMQELQPKIKALRAKYKKAKSDITQRRKMNEEMMKLYKEHGINPAGGCLPLLIQIPIFWGFFRMLAVSIEFRHSPFVFWINDLSVKDPYYVTPILMGITQFISQKMTPTTADPTQQRMMLIMPVVMTIFFMNFQSGLVLYWLTNNVLQIGQQYIMNKLMHKKKRVAHGKKRKK
jgi:YidC/Oxa1 family membrane protein insertase